MREVDVLEQELTTTMAIDLLDDRDRVQVVNGHGRVVAVFTGPTPGNGITPQGRAARYIQRRKNDGFVPMPGRWRDK